MMTELRRARQAAGKTALQLAQDAGATESRVYQLERLRGRVRLQEAESFAAVLQTSPDMLFPELKNREDV